MQSLLTLFNITQFEFWNKTKNEIAELDAVKIPNFLKNLKEIPLQSFLAEVRNYQTLSREISRTKSWLSPMCVVIIIVVISFVALVIIKRKYFAKRKSNSKPLANVHDHGEVKKKQSPTKQATEEIQMSVVENGENVSNDFEGQTPFKRTDATLTWPSGSIFNQAY